MATVTVRDVNANSNGLNAYPTGAFTPAAGELLVVLARVTGALIGAGAAFTASGSANGITFTRVGNGLDQGSAGTMAMFVANQLVPASPSSMTVSIDVTGDTGSGVGWVVYGVSGMSKTGLAAIRNNSGSENTGQLETFADIAANTPTRNFDVAADTNNPIVGMLCNNQNPAAVTPPTSFTEDLDTGHSGPTSGYEFCHRNSGHTSATVAWGASAGNWSLLIAELDTSAASTPNSGSASGSVNFAGSAQGATTHQGAASGSVNFAGSATGSSPNAGAASGSVNFAGSAQGSSPNSGSASGSVDWAGTATGSAPGVGPSEGSASGSVNFAGSAQGSAPHQGSASGSVDFTGSAQGETAHQGSASGSVDFAGSAQGATTHQGSASGSVDWAGAAFGDSTVALFDTTSEALSPVIRSAALAPTFGPVDGTEPAILAAADALEPQAPAPETAEPATIRPAVDPEVVRPATDPETVDHAQEPVII